MIRWGPVYIFVLCLALCAVGVGGQTPREPVQPPARAMTQPPLSALSPQQIFKRVAPSVMVVESLDAKGSVTAFGSGVVIAVGRVVTNRHVIEDGLSFKVEHDGKTWPAKLVRVDPDHDLAELSVAGLNAPAVRVRASSTLAVGEAVYAIGSPEGLELTISEGLISGLRDFDNDRVIQTSAAISPGSSGGGLFDSEGRLVGVTTFYLKGGQNLNFALPGEWVAALNQRPISKEPEENLDSPVFQALVWFELGYRAYKAGQYSQAVQAYHQALLLTPDDAGLWVNLGVAYEGLEQYHREVQSEQHAIRLEPGLPEAWDNLGVAYGKIGQWNESLRAELKAIRLKQSFEQAWANLGATYLALGQYDKAVGAEREAIQLKPDLGTAWSALGFAYVELAQYNKGLSAEKEAIRLKPDDEMAWWALGLAWVFLGKYANACSAERQAIRLKPDDAKAWYDMGLAFKGQGQQSNVIKVYEKLKTLDPKLADQFFREAVLH